MNIVTGVRTEVGVEGRKILWQFHDLGTVRRCTCKVRSTGLPQMLLTVV